jgi:hypothetical protein
MICWLGYSGCCVTFAKISNLTVTSYAAIQLERAVGVRSSITNGALFCPLVLSAFFAVGEEPGLLHTRCAVLRHAAHGGQKRSVGC